MTLSAALAAQAVAQPETGAAALAFLGIFLGLMVVIAVVFVGHGYWVAKRTRGNLTDSDEVVKHRLGQS